MRRTFKFALAASAIAAVGTAYAARDGSDHKDKAAEPPQEATSAPAGPSVPVAQVLERTIHPSTDFTGFLAAPQSVELRSRVSGAIEAVSVPEGSLVRKGEPLFHIDPRPFQVTLDTATAQLRRAEVLSKQAQDDLNRAQKLVETGAVSRKQYDDALATRNAHQAQVQVAKADVAAAQLELSYTHIRSPIAGRVDRVLVTEGNLVNGGATDKASLLTTIVSTDPIYAYFDIDEATYLKAIRQTRAEKDNKASALPVSIGLTTDQGFPYQGKLDFVGNQIDRSTGTIRARAVVPNPDAMLAPGLFARIRLATGAEQAAILIDDQAVGTDQGKRYVLVVDQNNQAQYRVVETGPMVDGLRVIKAGLQTGEKVIIKGLVRPGMNITPHMVSMQAVTETASAAIRPAEAQP
ncbi:efflux RND transporter periplasmic adaptor subunit [Alcaligenes parafaecalis]|uniref:Efflux RND transporter periplasmic adaptor subunit n=1 Tax=Alcaligenes parafaecalis TaxID=171260 RepID=A0ABT3VSQ6_9BURK|nr:efflux RND transporter periplasmic adaptor subunit [Alcaligenes parafaecalis]MCX5465250.1 efflux RND transporter periplasmic adaptor subunit [Alcaligenes parafaecalis]